MAIHGVNEADTRGRYDGAKRMHALCPVCRFLRDKRKTHLMVRLSPACPVCRHEWIVASRPTDPINPSRRPSGPMGALALHCVHASMHGAESRNRTGTVSPPRDFESRASTCSAISATQGRIIYDLGHSSNIRQPPYIVKRESEGVSCLTFDERGRKAAHNNEV